MPTLAGQPITENGLGLMRLTAPAFAVPDEVAFPVLRAALAKGANVWNGGDFYGTPEANSLHLLNRYFTAYPEDADKVVLCIKSGLVSMAKAQVDGSPENMRKEAEKCNAILNGKKKIDVFGCARVDPNISIEEFIAGMATLIKEGLIGGIQLIEVNAATIRRAAKVHEIAMVEAEVSLWATDIFSNGVAETCAELGITVCAHTPLGAGMLTGSLQTLDDLPANDHHRMFPRFQEENFAQNVKLVKEIQKLAKKKGCTPAQLALSWLKAQSEQPGMPFIVPIAGARSVERVIENCENVPLAKEDLQEIQSILDNFPVVGARWPAGPDKLNQY